MSPRPFLLSATVDFPDDVRYGPYSLELLEEMVLQIKSLGVHRIYWLYYGDEEAGSYWAGNTFDYMRYGRATVDRIGEPLKAVTPIAHRHGLEVYAVLKPFNTGLAGTYPEGSPLGNHTRVNRIGGCLQQVFPFVERFPHTRVARRRWEAPPDLDSVPIRKIRLLKADDSPTRIRRERLQIWTSADNYRYRRQPVNFSLADRVEASPREVREFFGDLLTASGAPVRTLTLEGLDLTDRYILVTTDFRDQEGDFGNAPSAMIEAYGPGPDPLPIVVATRSAMWIRPRDFRTGGLEFDSGMGPFPVRLDTDNASTEGTMFGIVTKSKWNWGGCIAFARGRNDTLACTPCAVHPEVEKLWTGWVDRLLAAGVDGVDVRVSAHGSLTDDPLEYGFNGPLLEECRERFGTEIGNTDGDRARLARLRGRHYTRFIREAGRRVRSAGKKFQVHVHAEAFGPDPCHGQLMGFPANLEFDWRTWLLEGLADGITLRTTWFEAPGGGPGPAPQCPGRFRCGRSPGAVQSQRHPRLSEPLPQADRLHAGIRLRPGADLPRPAIRRLRHLRVRPPLQAESERHEDRPR